MQITPNKVVSLHYQLQIADENNQLQTIDASAPDRPLVFLFGHGNLIVGFEKNIFEKKAEDSFDFLVTPEEGYGLVEENQIVNLDINIFRDEAGNLLEDVLKVGNAVPMNNDQGHRLQGVIKGITSSEVIMDFNHPLAGKELRFTGTIVSVREATQDELDHGHVHGDGGVHH